MTANEEFIDSCLVTGWQITVWHGSVKALTPPEGDPRINWCAEWEKVPYKGDVVVVPHWAAPGRYTDAKTI